MGVVGVVEKESLLLSEKLIVADDALVHEEEVPKLNANTTKAFADELGV
jgi:hypothetical protein